MSTPYDDIIDLPHHTSTRHPRMPLIDRAAQFATFQALTGYGEAILETARLTQEKAELTEEEQALLDEKLRWLTDNGGEAVFTYFKADEKKSGGAYVTAVGVVCRTDALAGTVTLVDGTAIPITNILSIEHNSECT